MNKSFKSLKQSLKIKTYGDFVPITARAQYLAYQILKGYGVENVRLGISYRT